MGTVVLIPFGAPTMSAFRRLFLAATLVVASISPAALRAADEHPPVPASYPGDSSNENKLTDQEKADGWKLLFDGKTLTGWNNFKKKDTKPGWQIKEGNLVCVDPKNASDLCTADQYDWFELSVDYNI